MTAVENVITDYFGVTKENIYFNLSRKTHVVFARNICQFFDRQLFGTSLIKIAHKYHYDKTHALTHGTVYVNWKKIREDYQTNKAVRAVLNDICDALGIEERKELFYGEVEIVNWYEKRNQQKTD